MNEASGYAVFLFPQAMEALGDAIKPYLVEGPGGAHVLCSEIDTGGSLIEMTLDGATSDGQHVNLELMVPTSMVRMIVSARGEGSFGFGPRVAPALMSTLPPVAGSALPADAPPQALPGKTEATDAEDAPTETPEKP